MKKKTIKIIGIIVIIILLILVGVTVIVGTEKEKNKVEKRKEVVYPSSQTILCVKEQGHDGVREEEEIYLENGVLLTRTNRENWTRSEPKEVTCKYYTQKSESLNQKPGVRSSCTCDDTRGTSTTTYTIAEIDREDLKLKQVEFLDQNNIFDVDSWILYMEEDNYICTKQ